MSNFKVEITGFNTLEEAKQFAYWYSCQGEQDIGIWLECRKAERVIECDSMNVESINVIDDTVSVKVKCV